MEVEKLLSRKGFAAFGTVLSVLFASWTGAKWLLDWIGRVDAIRSALSVDGSVSWAFRVLEGTPIWIPGVCALVATAANIYLVTRLRPSAGPLATGQLADVGAGATNLLAKAPAVLATRLLLQFLGDGSQPRLIDRANVHTWYTLQLMVDIVPSDTSVDGQLGRQQITGVWLLVVVFETPVRFDQFVVEGNGAQIPPHTIYHTTDRFALVGFHADPAGRALLFRTVSLDQ